MKIAVIGYSGAGKSTMAERLATHYGCPLLYLDKVNFEAGWKERDTKAAKVIVEKLMENDNWVIDGNYEALCQPRRFAEADRIIFMNYSRWICLKRVLKRYVTYKGRSRESAAEGCNEKIDFEFIKWVIYDGRNAKRRGNYRRIINDYRQKMIVLKNRKETTVFLNEIKCNKGKKGYESKR